MRAYSEDLRKKIVAAIERGMSKAQAARTFDVSLSSVKRYSKTARELEKEARLSLERAPDGPARQTRKPEPSSKRT
jgi:transposase